MNEELLKAIDLAMNNDWDKAHQIVQRYDRDVTAAWIHAVLHKIEGDLGNSQYWYSRAGVANSTASEPQMELAQIRRQLENA